MYVRVTGTYSARDKCAHRLALRELKLSPFWRFNERIKPFIKSNSTRFNNNNKKKEKGKRKGKKRIEKRKGIRIHSDKKEKKLKRQVDKRPPPHRSQSISSPKCCTSLGMPHSIYIDEAFEKRSLSQIRIAHTHLISLALNLNLSRYRKNCSTATDVFHFRNGEIIDRRLSFRNGNQRDRVIERFSWVTRVHTRNSGSVTGSMKRGIESILRNSHPCITSSFHLQQCLVCFHFPFSFPPRNCARIPRCEETPSRPRDRLNAKKRWQRGCSRIFPRERRGRVPGWICNAKGDVLGAIVELLGSLTRDECRLVLRIVFPRFITIRFIERLSLRNFPRFRPSSFSNIGILEA